MSGRGETTQGKSKNSWALIFSKKNVEKLSVPRGRRGSYEREREFEKRKRVEEEKGAIGLGE